MARKKYRTANLTADVAARKWADYMRLRRRPQKECRTCKHIYPNTLEHFAAGLRGRVGVRCHRCVESHPVPTRLKQECPCCGDFVRLVRDRASPPPVTVFMCVSCLRIVNGLVNSAPQTRGRLLQYSDWRLRQQNAGTLPKVPAVAEIASSLEASREPPD